MVVNQVYNWKRLWYLRGANVDLSPRGYPIYLGPIASIFNSVVKPFESIADTPCLVLLGEPGIGKSHTMQMERDAINAQIEESGERMLWLDLHSYGSEDRLVRALFENPAFTAWLEGEYKLHLFLDSLDECLLRVNTVAEILNDELVKYPVGRLCLRIACRTADWPIGLEDSLKRLWGQDAVGVYELAPLQREDIAEAARVNELSPDTFLAEVDRMDIAPLAIKPVTLDFLLKTYKRDGRFPPTQTELYQEGCRLLCEETNEGRRGARLTGSLTADERMAVAARIAAVTVFANKAAIWTSVDRGDVPEDDIDVRVLVGESESVGGDQFQVAEAAVRETLATGLFSSRGPNRMGWAHQTYAEFLAARYLVEHGATVPQMLSLITVPCYLEQKVVPQLQETAAWLAGMIPDVFRKVMRTDPLVLLRSDVGTVDERDREALVSELLSLYDEGKLLYDNFVLRGYYGRLAHPGLTEQLRPYILDATKGILVRHVATDIAEVCELTALQDELVKVTLDPSQPYSVRVNAAYAVWRIGDDGAKSQLRPLVFGQAGNDPDDELKGCGLLATWPEHLTAEEMFSVLVLPKRDNFSGAYNKFLYECVECLQPSDLPTALRWLEQQPSRHELQYRLCSLFDAILFKAWENLEAPDVLDGFARAVLSRLRRFDDIASRDFPQTPLGESLRNEVEKRRLLVETIIPLLSDPEREPPRLAHSRPPLVTGSDLLWMFDRFQEADSEHTRTGWQRLIECIFRGCDPDQVDGFFRAINEVPILSETFGWLFGPVDLSSHYAQAMRETTLAHRAQEENLSNQSILESSPSIRISELLDECESKDPTAWWQLNWIMNFREDGRVYHNELEPDLTALPGWEASDEEAHARVIETAKQYVLLGEPDAPNWLGTNTIYRPALAGYRALLLLLGCDVEFVLALPVNVWQKWAPVILAYPRAFGVQEGNRRQALIMLAYHHAPDEMIEALMALIDRGDQEGTSIQVIRDVEPCWDDRLADALLGKLRSSTLKPHSEGKLLDFLLKHGSEEARLFAESLVVLPMPPDKEEREKAVRAARVLMRNTIEASWPVIWPVIQRDDEFGQDVILPIAHDLRRTELGQQLSESRLADLYIWLSQRFPHAEDPQHDGFHAIEPRESIAEWRDLLLRYLVERGTYTACEAIERIIREYPELDVLKRALLRAQEATRRNTWEPPLPQDVLRIAANQAARLVNSGDELLEVLIEALKRLEANLQGETPAAREIWDRLRDGVYRPVDENDFSDYVKRHLEEDLNQRGIIINREVEIRRGTGGDSGERTDIHVNAVIPAASGTEYDVIAVIIETKGCWHSELETAMETQLVDRYLKDNQCQHGIYLVGWFDCAQWDDDDYRKRDIPSKSIDEMQTQFDAQATELSRREVHITAFVMNAALR
jgi:predicted NACHT family NTPase